MRTTVGINRMLSIRDVFLISAIVDERYADRDFLMSFAERPKLSRNAQRLEQLLSDSFRDPLARPDMKRCDQAINMLFDIIDMIPKTYRRSRRRDQLHHVVDGPGRSHGISHQRSSR